MFDYEYQSAENNFKNLTGKKQNIFNTTITDSGKIKNSDIESFHKIGILKDLDNMLVGVLFGKKYYLVNLRCNKPTLLCPFERYRKYPNRDFLWVFCERIIKFKGSHHINKRGGYLIHLPSNKYVRSHTPPEALNFGTKFQTDTNVIEWNNNKFNIIEKLGEDAEEENIQYENISEYNGKIETKKPLTDIRELKNQKWDFYLNKIVLTVPYIHSKDEAKKWLNGDLDYGPPNTDLRVELSKYLEEDEFDIFDKKL